MPASDQTAEAAVDLRLSVLFQARSFRFPMIELLGALFELIFGLLDILSIASWVADFFAWMKSKPSRAERRKATNEGKPIPPRSRSHVAFLVLTVCSVILTVLLVLKLAKVI
jgi:hypothetical protein